MATATSASATCRRAASTCVATTSSCRSRRSAPIIATRRLLQEALRTLAEGGKPRGADASYHGIRAFEKLLPEGTAWRDAIIPSMYAPVEELLAAR